MADMLVDLKAVEKADQKELSKVVLMAASLVLGMVDQLVELTVER